MIILCMAVETWNDVRQALAELDELYKAGVTTRKQQQKALNQIADLECALAATWKEIQVVGFVLDEEK